MMNEIQLTNASLSTMWAANNFRTLDDFFRTYTQLGFQKIELNHQVSSVMLSQANLDHCQFSSVHEPCPADIPTKELVERDWLISALDEDKRALGVAAVKKSIDLAHQLSAPVVIIHCGNIPIDGNDEAKLRGMFKTVETQSAEYLNVKQRLEDRRKSLIGPRLQSTKLSLQELIEYAARVNIKLGLENRYHFMDIPSIDEMDELLALADPSKLGFVYDVGHAQALDRLGFYPHQEWLDQFSSRMIGCHLHDVIGLTDHYAPGQGEIDFRLIADYLPENAIRTFEVLPGNTLAQLRDGLQLLIRTGCIRII
jgi:sugar phosphate isomerase/epimerase